MRGTIRFGAFLGLAVLLCATLPAAVITDLNNTGDTTSGFIDNNWGVVVGVSTDGDPCGGADLCDGSSAYVPFDQATTTPYGFTQPWYTGDSGTSAWIAPGVRDDGTTDETSLGAADQLDFGESTYVYSTTFNIDEAFGSASISGLWWADGRLNYSGSTFSDGLGLGNNCGIYVNSTCAYSTAIGFEDAWASTGSPFNLTSGFMVGENTLRFIVLNRYNETGLRVTFTDATVTPIPEPATYALIGAGLAAVALARRRRKV